MKPDCGHWFDCGLKCGSGCCRKKIFGESQSLGMCANRCTESPGEWRTRLQDELRSGKAPPAPSPRKSRCIHLGVLTGEKLPCQTCGGEKLERLHVCSARGRCTITRQVTDRTVSCCATCPQYQPKFRTKAG